MRIAGEPSHRLALHPVGTSLESVPLELHDDLMGAAPHGLGHFLRLAGEKGIPLVVHEKLDEGFDALILRKDAVVLRHVHFPFDV